MRYIWNWGWRWWSTCEQHHEPSCCSLYGRPLLCHSVTWNKGAMRLSPLALIAFACITAPPAPARCVTGSCRRALFCYPPRAAMAAAISPLPFFLRFLICPSRADLSSVLLPAPCLIGKRCCSARCWGLGWLWGLQAGRPPGTWPWLDADQLAPPIPVQMSQSGCWLDPRVARSCLPWLPSRRCYVWEASFTSNPSGPQAAVLVLLLIAVAAYYGRRQVGWGAVSSLERLDLTLARTSLGAFLLRSPLRI